MRKFNWENFWSEVMLGALVCALVIGIIWFRGYVQDYKPVSHPPNEVCQSTSSHSANCWTPTPPAGCQYIEHTVFCIITPYVEPTVDQ